MDKLSKNFNREEFACPCCGKDDIKIMLIIKLQELRDKIGSPILITSGVRCKKYNRKINGFVNSPHLSGGAADIQVSGMSPQVMALMAKYTSGVRLGIYPNHLHIDIVKAHPSKYWIVKKYGGEYIYSDKGKDLNKFIRDNM